MNSRGLRNIGVLFAAAVTSLGATSDANQSEPAAPPAPAAPVVVSNAATPAFLRHALLRDMQPGVWNGMSPSDERILSLIAPMPAKPKPMEPMRLVRSAPIKDACQPSLVQSEKFAAIAVHTDIFGFSTVTMDVAADEIRHPASMTKIMTLLLAFRAIEQGELRLDEVLTFTPSLLGMERSLKKYLEEAGTNQLTVEQTIQAAAVHSANDAAVLLARRIGGSEARFVKMMEEMRDEIGMRNSRFKNPSGLPDDEQVATAYDFALLMQYVQKHYPQYLKYMAAQEFLIPKQTDTAAGMKGRKRNLSLSERFIRIKGHLAFLGERFNGYAMEWGKTGYIDASGSNVAVQGRRPDGSTLTVVVMGGKSGTDRNKCVQTLVSRL